VLGAKVRKELRGRLRRLHAEPHATGIFVTHDQDEALEVADGVVLTDHGRVEQVGTPHEIHERPATPLVFAFLGASNRLPGDQIGVARPHAVDIVAARAGRLDAKVDRAPAFGAAARVVLPRDAGEHFEVALGREAADALALRSGQRVGVAPRRVATFADRASI
jgi:sulfate/thiosulfate transport system ATP-binding protein